MCLQLTVGGLEFFYAQQDFHDYAAAAAATAILQLEHFLTLAAELH